MKISFITLQREPVSLAAGLIAGGAALAGQGVNAYAQGKSNLRSRQFAEEMYARQRGDALADWNMQNAYNSPEAQMARFKKAGLNPHLIYGQQSSSPTVRSTEAQPWRPTAPQFDGGEVVGKYLNAQQQVVQTDNMRRMQEIIDAQLANLHARTIQTIASTDQTRLNIDTNRSLQKYSLQAAEQMVAKNAQDMQINAARNLREDATTTSKLQSDSQDRDVQLQRVANETIQTKLNAQMTGAQVQKIASDIYAQTIRNVSEKLNQTKTSQETENLKQSIKNLNTSNDLLRQDWFQKEWDNERRKLGRNPNSNILMQTFEEILERARKIGKQSK